MGMTYETMKFMGFLHSVASVFMHIAEERCETQTEYLGHFLSSAPHWCQNCLSGPVCDEAKHTYRTTINNEYISDVCTCGANLKWQNVMD